MRFGRIAVPVGAIIVGLGYFYDQQDPAATHLTAPIERGRIAIFVKASGVVAAVETVDVSSQLSGRIADVFVSFNSQVKAGQPIAQLDQEIFVAQVTEADAALRVARAAAELRNAALERANVAVAMAQSGKELGVTVTGLP